jgi:hypothetical protein
MQKRTDMELTLVFGLKATKKKGLKKRVNFPRLTYDLCYFFDDCVLDMSSP